MEYGEFKPLLTALAMPPAGPLLLALLGLLLARRALGKLCWCGTGVGLAADLQFRGVCGAGVLPACAEPGRDLNTASPATRAGGGVLPKRRIRQAHPSAPTRARLRYAVWLRARPAAASFSSGWGAAAADRHRGDVRSSAPA